MYNKNQSGSPTKVKAIQLPSLTKLNAWAKHVVVTTSDGHHTTITLYRYVSSYVYAAPVNLYAREGQVVCALKDTNETLLKLWKIFPDLEPATLA